MKKQVFTFEEKVKSLPNEELVATYQYVSGLFFKMEEQMSPKLKETATDLMILKHELLKRLNSR